MRVCGIAAAAAFVIVGIGFELQLYADGSMFSYAIAAQDAWDFHWHNISTRAAVYLYAHLPAETYVALTGDARGGIVLYGFLFFVAPLLGLGATWLADGSPNRTIFTYACLSTAVLCPMVFGFPTEMWIGHSVFWPTLALAVTRERHGVNVPALIFGFSVLMLTHESGVIFAASIVCVLLVRGAADGLLWRAALAWAIGISLWAAVRILFPPDAYYAVIIPRGARTFLDASNLVRDSAAVLAVALVGYAVIVAVARRWARLRLMIPIEAAATLAVAIGLAVYWLGFDHLLQAASRYPLRTLLMVALPILGAKAAIDVMGETKQLKLLAPTLPRWLEMARDRLTPASGVAIGALSLIMLVHGVETTKFVVAWQAYVTSLRSLAMGAVFDHRPGRPDPLDMTDDLRRLGDRRFISSDRLGARLNRLSWYSTTHYLSILVSPEFRPRRLVVDPDAGYFWLSCSQAKRSEAAARVIPKVSRSLVRVHACLNRPD